MHPPLPRGWVVVFSNLSPGRIYFLHEATGLSQWHRPEDTLADSRGRMLASVEENAQREGARTG
ncbi:hypothetical protein BC830DRAFT_19691 [Chytriomyces sp. MP71]|nr:hypothetical protein BC830DRAFT_19691 [Chytriomyces sp. MP71]